MNRRDILTKLAGAAIATGAVSQVGADVLSVEPDEEIGHVQGTVPWTVAGRG